MVLHPLSDYGFDLMHETGMDMTYALLKHMYGRDIMDPLMNRIEYVPHTDPDWDPFSVVHKVLFLPQMYA